MANKEVVKDIRTAVQLEQELQISYAQRGVAVVDVYSAEWGPCRAIAETFRRLATDQGDGVHLRFLSAECHSILASLKAPEEQRNHQRPKNIDAIRDTLPEGWQSILEERAGQSKPYFLFFKEGKRCAFVDGVNTPQIRATVKDLCTVKTPASEFITNPRLQEFWEENFNPEESEIPLDKFLKGLASACKYTVAFSDAEKQLLLEAIGVPKDAKEKTVTAEGLQKWFGDDEVKTIQVLVVEVLPEYEARAAQALLREAEERKAHEEQRAREAKEEETRLSAERDAEEERKKSAAAAAAANKNEESLDELLSKVPELASASDSREGPNDEALRSAVSSAQLAAVVTRLTVSSGDEVQAKASALLETIRDVKSLSDSLLSVHSIVAINALRSACDQKIARPVPSLAKLAEVLATADSAFASQLTGRDVNFRELLESGSLIDEASVALTLIATAAVSAPTSLYFSGARDKIAGADALVEGGSFALGPLSLLSSEQEADAEFVVTFTGLPFAVAIGGVYATHWFSLFTVSAVTENRIEAAFSSYVSQEDLDTIAANFSTATNADEKKFQVLEKIQTRADEASAAAEQPKAETVEERAPALVEPAVEAAPQPAAEAAPESAAEAAAESDPAVAEVGQAPEAVPEAEAAPAAAAVEAAEAVPAADAGEADVAPDAAAVSDTAASEPQPEAAEAVAAADDAAEGAAPSVDEANNEAEPEKKEE